MSLKYFCEWYHDEYNSSYTWCCIFTLRAFLFWVLIHIIAYIYVFLKCVPHRVVSSNFSSLTCLCRVTSPCRCRCRCRCYIGTEILEPKLFNYALKLNNLIVQHILNWYQNAFHFLHSTLEKKFPWLKTKCNFYMVFNTAREFSVA